jgi:hypothetical protein
MYFQFFCSPTKFRFRNVLPFELSRLRFVRTYQVTISRRKSEHYFSWYQYFYMYGVSYINLNIRFLGIFLVALIRKNLGGGEAKLRFFSFTMKLQKKGFPNETSPKNVFQNIGGESRGTQAPLPLRPY